ncbi:MAG: oligosaccharide flippase family protein [Muribaculaceae bacterium]|nr:oligosaccharide flippase family protein [Muribaculaceae bacterium]
MADTSNSRRGRRSIRSGAVWSLAERVATQAVAFVVTLIMARLLTPDDFGLIGMLLILTEVGTALSTSGLSHALIRRGEPSPEEAGSVLLFNIFSGCLLYALIWIGAPAVARFYDIAELAPLARGMGLVVPLRALATVKLACLSVRLDFRRQALATSAALLGSGAVGIAASMADYGAWAIVGFHVSNALLSLVFVWIACPGVRFGRWNTATFRSLHRFGAGIMGAALADFAHNNAYMVAIGRLLPVADVGFFTRARQLASVPAISMSEVIRRVAYPVLCRCSSDREAMLAEGIRMMKIAMAVCAPVMLFLASISSPLILLILGEKWLPAAPMMTILCLGTLWIPLDVINLWLLPAAGHTKLLFRVELARKSAAIAILLATMAFGMIWICIGYAGAALLTMIFTACVTRRVSGLRLRRQFGPVGAIIAVAAIAVAGGRLATAPCGASLASPIVSIAVNLAVSAGLYLAMARIFFPDIMNTLFAPLRSLLHRRKPATDSPSVRPVVVLHVYPRLTVGGIENVILNIIRYSDRERFRHEVLVQEEGDVDEIFREHGATIHRVPFDGDREAYRRSVAGLMRERGVAAVHAHQHHQMMLVNEIAKGAGVACRIAHSHSSHQDWPGWKRSLRLLKFHRNSRGATHCVGCSREALEWLFPLRRVSGSVAINGIATDAWRFDPEARLCTRKELGISESTTVFLNVGRCERSKNQDFILTLARERMDRDELFIIVGDGPLYDSLRDRIERERIDNVVLYGRSLVVDRLTSMADVFLFPSVYEGLPLAALEAQTSGLTVLLSDQIPSEADMRLGNSVVLPLADRAAWHEAMSRPAPSPQSRARYGALAADSPYDIRRAVGRIEALYPS